MRHVESSKYHDTLNTQVDIPLHVPLTFLLKGSRNLPKIRISFESRCENSSPQRSVEFYNFDVNDAYKAE